MRNLLKNQSKRYFLSSLLQQAQFSTSQNTRTALEGSPAKLYFQFQPSSAQQPVTDNLVVFHGLFGSHTNFRAITRSPSISSLVNTYSMDLRNHGNSEHKDDMSLKDMGEDIVNFLEEKNLHDVYLMGHSMGGRAIMSALQFYGNALEGRVKGIIICDISPGNLVSERSADVFEMWNMINSLLAIDFHKKTRLDINNEVRKIIPDQSVAGFMLMNIVEDETKPERLKWRMNLKAIRDWYKENLATEISGANWKGPCSIICGSRSHFVNQSKIVEFNNVFPNMDYDRDVHFIRGAGHWLHADKPKEFTERVSDFIKNVQSAKQ